MNGRCGYKVWNHKIHKLEQVTDSLTLDVVICLGNQLQHQRKQKKNKQMEIQKTICIAKETVIKVKPKNPLTGEGHALYT